jgi:hypothetical protein
MKVDSPVGEYEYRVRGVTLDAHGVHIAGSLGVWETTFTIEPADGLALARHVAPALAVVAAATVCGLALRGRRAKGC